MTPSALPPHGQATPFGGLPRILPSGTSLGRYRLLEPIGRGGAATVYRAWDEQLGREVAAKLLPPLASSTSRARFAQEARTTARLRHPHIVSVHGAGELAGAPWLVMDLVDGRSLQQISQTSPRPPAAETARTLREVASAIHYAHGEGVLHRDIKPGNILVDGHGHAWVVDFGIARIGPGDGAPGSGADSLRITQDGALLGTPYYMAPEQAGGGPVDARSDVWGLGATLHQALTGQPPFGDEDPIIAVHRRRPDPPSSMEPTVPRALDRIVARCLERDPARRYPSAGALVEALDRFIAQPAGAMPARSGLPAPLVAGAVVVAAGAAFLVGVIVLRGATPEGTPASDPATTGATTAATTTAPRPPDRDPLDELLAASRATDDPDEVIALLDEALAIAPDGADHARVEETRRELAEAMADDAVVRTRAGDPVDGSIAARFDRAARLARLDRDLQASILLRKTDYLFRRARWEDAIAAAESVTRGRPGLDARYLRAKALSKLGRRAAARSAMERIAEEDAGGVAGTAALASIRATEWSYEESNRLYREVLAREPDHRQALVGLAIGTAFRGQPDAAREAAEHALRLAPDASRAHMALGFARMHVDPLGAVQAFTRSIELTGDAPDATTFRWRGRILIGLGRLDDARRDMDRSLQLRPDSADALIFRGHVCWLQGAKADAIRDWRRAWELDGKFYRRRLGDMPPEVRQAMIDTVNELQRPRGDGG